MRRILDCGAEAERGDETNAGDHHQAAAQLVAHRTGQSACAGRDTPPTWPQQRTRSARGTPFCLMDPSPVLTANPRTRRVGWWLKIRLLRPRSCARTRQIASPGPAQRRRKAFGTRRRQIPQRRCGQPHAPGSVRRGAVGAARRRSGSRSHARPARCLQATGRRKPGSATEFNRTLNADLLRISRRARYCGREVARALIVHECRRRGAP